jgi:DNA-binding transcriptional ArsR family regulator
MSSDPSATEAFDETRRHPPEIQKLAPNPECLTGKCLLAYYRRRHASVYLPITLLSGDLFKALAEDTRRKILDELTERDGQTLFEICSRLALKHRLGSSRQAISQHLDVLESAGLVETRREGRYKFHYLNTEPLEHIADRWLRGDKEGST